MKCVCVRSDGEADWYTIERAEHDGREWLESTGPHSSRLMMSCRLGNACIEGPGSQMLAIAAAIEGGTSVSFKRCCALLVDDGYGLMSPRNSDDLTIISFEDAAGLASSIRRVVEVIE
jgi:hypothetical protein